TSTNSRWRRVSTASSCMRTGYAASRGAARRSEARVDRLALERQDPEDALVDAVQRLLAREALQRLHAQRELAQRQRALGPQAAAAQPRQVLGQGVLRAIDDAQVLAAAALQGRLGQAARACCDEVERLHDHPFAPGRGE